MELTMSRVVAQALFHVGEIAMLDLLGDAAHRATNCEFGLYSMSRDWTYASAVKVIKCRGQRGDVLVRLV